MMRVFILTIMTLFLSANAYASSWHTILGSDNRGWSNKNGQYEVKYTSFNRDVRLVKNHYNQEYPYHIEFSGPINSTNVSTIIGMLEEVRPLHKGTRANGTTYNYIVPIYLDSNGGVASEGIRLGEAFRRIGVKAQVTDGQVCASACADAFIGAKFRTIYPGGIVAVHSPYTTGNYGATKCIPVNSPMAQPFKDHAYNMLGQKDGQRFINNSFRTCSTRNLVYFRNSDKWLQN